MRNGHKEGDVNDYDEDCSPNNMLRAREDVQHDARFSSHAPDSNNGSIQRLNRLGLPPKIDAPYLLCIPFVWTEPSIIHQIQRIHLFE
jgi:hypothetical protein